MRYRFLIVFLLVLSLTAFAGKDEPLNAYYYTVDLVNVRDDKVIVSLIPPKVNTAEAVFRFPAFVPGTYEVYDFGRFVSNFKVFDAAGNQVSIEKLDANSWKITDPSLAAKITYEVNDTWDTELKDNVVFEPGGSNIESGKNFVLNNHCFFGYFDGYKKLSFKIDVLKPAGFYGSTALIANDQAKDRESFLVSDYMELVDSPMMFCEPDTTFLTVGNAKVLVSVFSSQYKNVSKPIAKNIEAVLLAQKDFLGGRLPIDKYAFIIYLFPGYSQSGAYGALEHNNSSFYFLPGQKPEELAAELKSFCAHEFFHIITPLTVHSEEIGDFQFNDPKMSRHLWMYEGVTEYFAGSVQVKYGLMTEKEYLNLLHQKMQNKDSFLDTLPFTTMSLGCLEKYREQYDNVYEKGALIGLCFDLKLLQLSNGKYGLKELMSDLSKKYGKDKSFKDEQLFDEIVRLTFPEIRPFIDSYIAGNKPLPLKEMLDSAGIEYIENGKVKAISPLGGIIPSYSKITGRLYISQGSYANINDFGKTIGLNIDDQLLKLNGTKLTEKNMEMVIEKYFLKAKEGGYLRLQVMRADDKGKPQKVNLKAKIVPAFLEEKHLLDFSKKPTDRQLFLRKALLTVSK